MKDKILVCSDCRQEFVWTGDEQVFYASKGLDEPKHCLVCRGKFEAKVRDLEKYKKSFG